MRKYAASAARRASATSSTAITPSSPEASLLRVQRTLDQGVGLVDRLLVGVQVTGPQRTIGLVELLVGALQQAQCGDREVLGVVGRRGLRSGGSGRTGRVRRDRGAVAVEHVGERRRQR